MNIKSNKGYYRVITLALSVLLLSSHSIIADEEGTTSVKSPVRLNREMLSGIGIETAPWDDESRSAKWSQLFTGKELSVSVFESTPKKGVENEHSKYRVKSYPYDQFVLVLNGKSILTDEAGNAQTFVAGDTFVMPRGFSGTWEEFGVYRELIVVEEEAMRTRQLDIEQVD